MRRKSEAASPAEAGRPEVKREPAKEVQYPPFVSLYAIVANPERFDGQQVITAGVASVGHEGAGLVLNQEARRYGLFLNGVNLDVADCADREKVLTEGDGKWCWFKAVVDARNKGREGREVGCAATLRVIRCTRMNKAE